MKKLVSSFVFLFLSPAIANQIKLLPTKNEMYQRSFASDSGKILQIVSQRINVNQYREVKMQIIRNSDGSAHHALVYFSRIGYHQARLSSVFFDRNDNIISIDNNYRMQLGDIAQQPGNEIDNPPVCPDTSLQFVVFAENDIDVEQQTATEVASFASSHGLKTVALLKAQATRQNYLNVLKCPNLKGNFYDGDTGTDFIETADGAMSSDEIIHFLAGAMKFQVTNVWLACQAFLDPIKTAMLETVQAQKYAAGINDLLTGPSDKTGACTMEAAISGQPITQSFQDCYKQFDVPQDQWGIDGHGSDFFGKAL